MQRRCKRLRGGRVLLGAVCGLIFFFLLVPLAIVFPISVSSAKYLQFPPPGFSWRWYENYFNDHVWIDATLRSIKIACAVSVLSLTLGVALAFGLTRGQWVGRKLIERLTLTPLIMPAMVIAVAIYAVFAKLQLIGAWYGVALAHTMMALPFVMITVLAGMRSVDPSHEQAALGLGASRWQVTWRITFPQIRPSLVTAGLLAFISSFDELVISMFLAGTQMTLPKKMFDNILQEIDPTIAAVSVLQILLIIGVLVLVQRFGRSLDPAAGRR